MLSERILINSIKEYSLPVKNGMAGKKLEQKWSQQASIVGEPQRLLLPSRHG